MLFIIALSLNLMAVMVGLGLLFGMRLINIFQTQAKALQVLTNQQASSFAGHPINAGVNDKLPAHPHYYN